MNKSMEEYRQRLDTIDAQLLELFLARMRVAEEIAEYKKSAGIPVEDKAREEELIEKKCAGLSVDASYYVKDFFEELIALSKDIQRSIAEDGEEPISF